MSLPFHFPPAVAVSQKNRRAGRSHGGWFQALITLLALGAVSQAFTSNAAAAVPTVIAPNKSLISSTTATLSGNVSSNGGATLTARGVVYSLTSANADPTIGGSGVTTVPEGSTTTGAFSVAVSSLTANSAYTYKAYATNGTGTGYTAADTFTTAPTPGAAGPPTLPLADANSALFTRPGGQTFTWTFTVGSTGNPNKPGEYPITNVTYYNVTAFSWVLSRGAIEYASSTAGPWTNLNVNTNPNYIPVASRVFRFRDTQPSDTTTSNSVGVGWQLSGVPGGSGNVGSGATIIPDNAPTDITSSGVFILSTAATGDALSTITPADTGRTQGGRWTIDAQSVGNLFALQYDNTTGNTATLTKGTGTMPAVGQTATVTLRYNDWFQVDANDNAVFGQGFSKTLTYTVVSDSTNDLGTFANDTQANTYTTSYQYNPAITTLSNGNYVVVWQSNGQGKSSTNYNGIYGQLFSSTGTKVGGEFVISNNSTTTDEQTPAVTALNAGRFAVAYTTNKGTYTDAGVRIVEANGTVSSEIIAETTVPTASEGIYNPAITTLTDGSFVVAWGFYSSPNSFIRLQQFAAASGAKIGSEVTVRSATDFQMPGIAALSTGSYVVCWNDSTSTLIKAQIGPSGTPFSTGLTAGSGTISPRVASYSGGFVVVTDPIGPTVGGNPTYPNIQAALFTNSGTAQGSQFTVNTRTSGNRFLPTVASLSGGGFVVVWEADSDDGFYYGISGRRYDSTGTAVDAADFQVNQYRSHDQETPVVTGLGSNLFASAWTVYPDTVTYADSEVVTRVLLPAATPAITAPVSTTTLSSTTFGTPGAPAVSFNITAANLSPTSGSLTVTAPTNTQVSADGSTSWGTSFTIPYTGGTLASTAVYVRLDGTGTLGTITGNVAISGGGATTANAAVSGALNAGAPTVTSISSTTTNGSYSVTTVIPITVTFSAAVTVTGTPTLALNSGGTASYASGSGTSTLTFNYTVAASQNSADLDCSSTTALALAGGTINATTGGTAATLTLPTPGGANSLGLNKAIVIDTTAPTITSIVRLTPTGQTTGSNTVTFRVTYSETVTVPGITNFAVVAVNGSNIVGTVTSVTGSGTTRDVTVNITSGTGEFRLRGVN